MVWPYRLQSALADQCKGAKVDQTSQGKKKGTIDKPESSQPRGKAKNIYQPQSGHPIDGGVQGQPEEKVFKDLTQVLAVQRKDVDERFFLVSSCRHPNL